MERTDSNTSQSLSGNWGEASASYFSPPCATGLSMALCSVDSGWSGSSGDISLSAGTEFSANAAQVYARRHNAYAKSVLNITSEIIQPLSLYDIRTVDHGQLPILLTKRLHTSASAIPNTAYKLKMWIQTTAISIWKPIKLPQRRNRHAASALLAWYKSLKPEDRPDIILTPNGSIMEMGAIFQTADISGFQL